MKILRSKYLFHSLTVLLLLLVAAGCGLVKSLGKNPQGDDLARIQALPNYKNGTFQNLDSADNGQHKVKPGRALKAIFNRPRSVTPQRPVPWVKTDLKNLTAAQPTVVWFGHSSVLIKTQSGNILIDPVFNDHAGPIPGMVKAFDGTTHYSADDMPDIDVLIISHDHYDHLDYRTVKKLKSRIKKAVVPMGVGSHLVYWGFDRKNIVELNWNQSYTLASGLKITATPARHRSNRTFAEKKTLWASYVIQANGYRLFYSGDGGYGSHFKQIGQQYGPFNLALMECGQYNQAWLHHHMLPAQTAQAAADLHARMIQPVHWAKFAESAHPWNEPVNLLLPAAVTLSIPVSIPLIGEPFVVGNAPRRTVWWAFE
ncbi:MBL fold metallo-hydrolase [Mucilaginibacter sp. PAMB04274]|uniref:MBL fold metallo-hydrolase n=1 Tax=Mucilaginibacter sp. PAMB04274 TaxID=3138568 RepID=UPI0031F61352